MKHTISHSNKTITVRIEIEAPLLNSLVREVLAHAEAAINSAKSAGDGDTTLKLKTFGPNKIQIIKTVREYTGMGLKEAKDLVEKAPVTLATGIREDLLPYYLALKASHVNADVTLYNAEEAVCDDVVSS